MTILPIFLKFCSCVLSILSITVPKLIKTNEKIKSNTGFRRTHARMHGWTNKIEFIAPFRLKLEFQK